MGSKRTSISKSILFSIAISLIVSTFQGNPAFACNPFKGNWVYDRSYPLYEPETCPHIRREFDCIKYGRRDKLYLKYRWQPDSCQLPRFDGKEVLRRWRGKKIMFVGDSLSLNQFESFLCLIHAGAPDVTTDRDSQDDNNLTVVTFQHYNLKVMYYASHYLVDIVREAKGRILKLDSMQAPWGFPDVLIFNTGHWWPRSGPSQPWDYIQEGDMIMKDMDTMEAFSKGLETWAKWVDNNVNSSTTKVFYLGFSPDHYHGEEWGASRRQTCSSQTQPITDTRFYTPNPLPQETIVKNIISNMKKPAYLLDITYLSQLRKDAHPSKFNGINFRNDCSHWCIPGLPDTWNNLLYAALVYGW